MDSSGLFLETKPDASEFHLFGAQVVHIVNDKVWIGGSVSTADFGRFCPMILKTDSDLNYEFAYTSDCSGKSTFYSVDMFIFNLDPSNYFVYGKQSYALASPRAINFDRVLHTSFLIIVFQ